MNRVEPNRNVYIGHRYVPLLVGEWDKSIQYEGLSIVTFQGASYTSKKMTPPGIDIENDEFWVLTGNYDAQVEYYRLETERVSDDLEQAKIDLNKRMNDTEEYVDSNIEDLTIYVNDEVRKNKEYVDTNVDDLTIYVNDEVRKNKEYVDTELAELNTKLTHITYNLISDFGAVGDGIADDTQAIKNGFNALGEGVTLTIPRDVNLSFNEKIVVYGKSGFKIIANGSQLIDDGKLIQTEAGETSTSVGIQFINCSDFEIVGMKNVSTSTSSAKVIPEQLTDLVPVVDFSNCFNFRLLDISGVGEVGPSFDLSEGVANLMRGSFYRFLDCNNIKIDSPILTEAVGGEIAVFYKCNKLLIDDIISQQGENARTFWSILDIIACDNVFVNNTHIQGLSTGSLFDVNGGNINFNNVHSDYPNGKFCDVTSEWDEALMIDGVAPFDTDVNYNDCSTNGDTIFSQPHGGTTDVVRNKKVIIDNFKTETTGIDVRNLHDVTIKNTEFKGISSPILSQTISESYAYPKKVTIENTTFNNDGNITFHGYGETTFVNSVFDLNGNNLTFRDYESGYNEYDLSHSDTKFIFKNTVIKNAVIRVSGNLYFDASCELIDCQFRIGAYAELNNNGTLNIKGDIRYTEDYAFGNPFAFQVGSNLNLTLDGGKVLGIIPLASERTPYFNSAGVNNVTINKINFDLRRITNGIEGEIVCFNINRSSNDTIKIFGSAFNNCTLIETQNATLNTETVVFDMQYSSLNGGNQMVYSHTDAGGLFGKINMVLAFNKFDDGYLTSLLDREEYYNSLSHGGNFEM